MHICMVSQYLPNIGGIENVVSDLSVNLVKEGHRVSVVSPTYPECVPFSEYPEELDGVLVYRFKTTIGVPFGLDELRNMYRMILTLNDNDPIDLIHSHFAKNEGLVGIKAALKLWIPQITTVHGSDIMDQWGGMCEKAWSRYWVKRVLRRSYRLTTVSEFLKGMVIQHGIPEVKVRVIHNWIDPSMIEEISSNDPSHGKNPKDLRKKKNSRNDKRFQQTISADQPFDDPSKFRIVTARRFVKKNGVDILIQAVKELKDSNFLGEPHLHILADGPERTNLIALVEELGLSDCVTFHGSVSRDIYLSILRNGNAWVVPSRWEGFGMVILEAFAAGTPVIATKVGGIPEILRHRENGLLVDPEPGAIADAIRDLFHNPGLRASMMAGGKDDIRDHFNIQRGLTEWIDYYKAVIQNFE